MSFWSPHIHMTERKRSTESSLNCSHKFKLKESSVQVDSLNPNTRRVFRWKKSRHQWRERSPQLLAVKIMKSLGTKGGRLKKRSVESTTRQHSTRNMKSTRSTRFLSCWLSVLAWFSCTLLALHQWLYSLEEAGKGGLNGHPADELEMLKASQDQEGVAVYNSHHTNNASMRHAFMDSVTIEMSTTTVPSSNRTMILFVTSKDNDLNRKRIAEMRHLFKNNFMVVWGNVGTPTCPFQDMKDAGLCLDQYQISKSHRLSHVCCAQEMAFMWAIENRQSFNNVWFMEDDVYSTDISELEKIISLNSTNDLLHQAPDFHPFQDQWLYANEVRRHAKGHFHDSEIKTSLFNLFRMSTDFLAALEQVYVDLGKKWFFFEALLPSVVVSNHFNLTHASWLRQLKDTNSTYVMTVMPRCMTHFEKPGVYHPVKYQDGNFISCPLRLYAPDVIEGSPYKNQVSKLRSTSSKINQSPLVHGCVGPLGGSTNWNAIAGWVKYHEERWGLTHADIFVLHYDFHVARDSFDAVGLDTSTVALNFTLYLATTNGEAWLAKECRTNAIVGKRDFLIEFELDRFLVSDSDSFNSLQDIFYYTNYPDAVVFPTFTNNYGMICSSNAMTFASATFVDHLFPNFDRAPSLCPRQKRCHMSDGVIRHFMIGKNDDQTNFRDAHLIRFVNSAVGLHEDLSTKACLSVKDCKHIGEDGECTDMNEIAFFEQQVTSVNSILSDLDLTPKLKEMKHNAICYAQRYPDLFNGFCDGNVSKCLYGALNDHYVEHGSAADLIWECDRDVSEEIKQHAICYAKRYPDLFAGFCNGDVSKCRYGELYDHYVNYGSVASLLWECDREVLPAMPVTPRFLGG